MNKLIEFDGVIINPNNGKAEADFKIAYNPSCIMGVQPFFYGGKLHPGLCMLIFTGSVGGGPVVKGTIESLTELINSSSFS